MCSACARTASVALAYVAAALALRVEASVERSDFRWRAPILEPVQSGTLYRALIPFHVFDGSKAYPADFRLLDPEGHEIPFYIQSGVSPDRLLALPAVAAPTPADERPADGVGRLYLDAGFKGVPLRRVVLQAAETNFARTVKIYGRNAETNVWRWMTEGALHRLPDRERNGVDLNDHTFRFLKIEILNFDEPPITITNFTILAEPQFLVFQAHCDGPASVYFGSSSFALPLHELRHQLPARALSAARHAAIGPREENPHLLRAELRSYARLLLISTFVICVPLAAAVFLKRLRG